MPRWYNTVTGQYIDSETGSVSSNQSNDGEWYYTAAEANAAKPKTEQAQNTQQKTTATSSASTNNRTSNTDRISASQSPTSGSTTTTPAATKSYYIRDGVRYETNFADGRNTNTDGSAISWKPGDISVTPSGQYWIIGDDGKARQISSENTNDTLTLLNALGNSNGYTPKGTPTQIAIQQGFEGWLQANDPAGWKQFLNLALEWNAANTRGDTAAANAIHNQMENFRAQYGHVGGVDGTITRVVSPNAIPEDLRDMFAPLLEEYNQSLATDIAQLTASGMPTYQVPNIADSPNAQLALMKIGQYPELVQAIVKNAPNSVLAYQLTAAFPEYTVGAGLKPMEGLNYKAQYMPQYWNDFQNTYDYEKYAPEYDAIRDQLIAANQAGVDLGRLQLEAQLENALPQYDELRRQNALAQAKAANNVALYNTAQGDLGGIGSRRYSLEQNAYDQRMNEIQLEQQNLINQTNQQIAQLEAQGKMQEAKLLAEWGQAKLEAMQEQYNLYWNMYQQGAAAMENLEYGIASDEWNRQYKIRQDELDQQQRAWEAELAAYNAAVDRAKTNLSVDESNRDYNYNKWLAETNLAMQQAEQQNNYNAAKRADAVNQQKLQLSVDESNRDYDWNKWLTDANLAISQADKQYARDWEQYTFQQELRQLAFENAITKLGKGLLSDADIAALGVPAEQAQSFADRINLLAQLDVEQAKMQLDALRGRVTGTGTGTGYGSSGSKSSNKNDDALGTIDPITGEYVYYKNSDRYYRDKDSRLAGAGTTGSTGTYSQTILNPHDADQVQVENLGTVGYEQLSELVQSGIVQQISTPQGWYYIRNKEMNEGR